MRSYRNFIWISFLILLPPVVLAGCGNSTPVSTPVKPIQTASATLEAPDLSIFLDKAGFSESGLRLQMRASFFNPNSSSVNIDFLKVTIKNGNGKLYAQNDIAAGAVPASSAKSFNFNIDVSADVLREEVLTAIAVSKITTGKTEIPFTASTLINMGDIKVSTMAPRFAVNCEFPRFTSNGVNMLLETKVKGSLENPHPLRLDFSTIRLVIKDRTGNIVATASLAGNSISPGESHPFETEIALPLRIMNERGFTLNLETLCGIGRFDRTATLTSSLAAPDLKSLISPLAITLKTEPSWKTGSPWPTPLLKVSTNLKNTNWFAVTAGNTTASIYTTNGSLIKSIAILETEIAGASEKTLSTEVGWGSDKTVPQAQMLNIKVSTEIGFSGINEKIPLNASTTAQILPPL